MRALNRAIDRFSASHPRFGIPNLMIFIVIGNVIVYLFALMDRTGLLQSYLAFSADKVIHHFQLWRIITFVFVPNMGSGGILGLAISLYFYYFVGTTLERQWGQAKFTIYYLSGILLTVIYGFVLYFITGKSLSLTAGYINLSMFFAFATMFPDMRVLLFFFIPIKMKWLALVDAAFFLLEIIITSFPANLLPLVALLNYFIFCGGYLLEYIRPERYGATKSAINFKKAAKKAKRDIDSKPYRHKCAVCGKTDTDYPDLEFRYCSRCAGYHCFCIDHINNHVHFTE